VVVLSVSWACPHCIEIGWRLARVFCGKGYATDAAQVVLDCAFGQLAFAEIVAFTAEHNSRSQGPMQRLHMANTAVDNPLCEHVLYRLTRERWQQFTELTIPN